MYLYLALQTGLHHYVCKDTVCPATLKSFINIESKSVLSAVESNGEWVVAGK